MVWAWTVHVRGFLDPGERVVSRTNHVYSAMDLSNIQDQAERKVREITAGLERMLRNSNQT